MSKGRRCLEMLLRSVEWLRPFFWRGFRWTLRLLCGGLLHLLPTRLQADVAEAMRVCSTWASGCSLIGPNLSRGEGREMMAQAVEASENAMRCRIPVLVITKVIMKGEPLNRYVERIEAPASL